MAKNTYRKKPNRIVILAVLVAVILIIAVVGAYYGTLPSQPTAKATPVTNFSDGSWANYTENYYDESGQSSPGGMMTYTISGTYKNQECWNYVENMTWTDENGTWVETDTYYLNKSTYENLGQTCQVYNNGTLSSEKEFATNELANDLENFGNMTIIAKDQTVTVPAGTFSCTEQKGPIYYAGEDTTYDVTVWAKNDIPNWGVVKYQFYLDGALVCDYLLESYGS